MKIIQTRIHGTCTYMLAAAVLTSIGCGGGGGIDADAFPVEFETALCENLVRCGQMPDLATCQASTFLDESPQAAQLVADIQDGIIDYDGEAAQTCLDAFRDQSCERFADVTETLDVCEQVIRGTVAVGGECFDDDHCAGDAECDDSACGSGECCAGVCVAGEPELPDAHIGEDCREADCVDGAFCLTDPVTFDRRCAEQADEGEQCEGFGGCLDGMFCSLDVTTGLSTCIRLPGEGEACDTNMELVACVRPDNFCDPTDSICKPRLVPGDTCDTEIDHCALYAACNGAACQARPVQGEPCTTGAEECLGDLQCTNSVCAAPEFEAVCNSDSAS